MAGDEETGGRAQIDAREKSGGAEQTDGDQLTEHRQKTDVHAMESKAPDDQKTAWDASISFPFSDG